MTERRLKVAPNISLPLQAVTWTFSALAMKGAGKSNVLVVMAEEMHKAGLHWFAIDPKGDWWGIQSSGDGLSPGLEVPIFGGEHQNYPIYPDSGAVMADLIVGEGISCLIDLSEFTNTEMFRFLGGPDFGDGGRSDGFFARLYKRKNRNQPPTHGFLEEVDEYLPQQVTSRIAKLHYDGQRVSTKGRQRGLGVTCATQRPARFHNDVLTQTENLIAMRNMAPPELKQVELWVKFHGQSKEIVQSLPSLEDGEAWFVSPQKMKVVKRVKFRRRETLDTGSTPEVIVRGKRRPPTLAEIDGSKIETLMADTIERAKAEDPTELQREIAQMRRDLKAAQDQNARLAADLEKRPTSVEPVEVHVPVFDPGELEGLYKFADEWFDRVQEALSAQPIIDVVSSVHWKLDHLRDQLGLDPARWPTLRHAEERTADFPPSDEAPKSAVSPDKIVASGGIAAPLEASDVITGELTKPHRKVLDALAWWESVGVPEPTKVQLGFVAGYRTTKKIGGGYGNLLGQLHGRGLIRYPQPGTAALTDAGRRESRPLGIPATTRDLQETFYAKLKDSEKRVLKAAIEVYPKQISKQHLGEKAGYSVGEKVGGGYGNILGRLRSLGLIEYPTQKMVAASAILFLSEAA